MAPRKATAQVPTLGRIVHYYTDPGGEQRAAIVSEVEGGAIGLHVLNELGVHYLADVPGAPVPTPGHWSWPDAAPKSDPEPTPEDDDNSDD